MSTRPELPKYAVNHLRKVADEFREQNAAGELPVDIMAIIELDLQIEVRPVKQLKEMYDIDALIMSNMDIIYVDQDEYMDSLFSNRLRFSLAHELGHRLLHRDFYESLNLKNMSDAYNFMKTITDDEYTALERDADEFAGRLLVPPETLLSTAQTLLNANRDELQKLNVGLPLILASLTPAIAFVFGTSEAVITRRIQKERIIEKITWP